MNILLLGSGGREHAIAQSISKSKRLGHLYIAPGNAGTKTCGTNLDIDITDFEMIAKEIIDKEIEMLIVGPEQALVNGLKDFLLEKELNNILFIGPDKAGAQLEGSKAFSKVFMMENEIPTADFIEIERDEIELGKAFLQIREAPYVIKADGLAAGKGVLILDNKIDALESLNEMLSGKFGEASKKVVIEDFMKGLEFSVFVLTDGDNYKILPTAKDYKKINEGDQGLNTGGMGAVSPVPFVDKELLKRVENEVILPTLKGLKKLGIDYIGFLYLGFINTEEGPKMLEYNIRMGDPETQVVFPKIKTDIITLFEKTAKKQLNEIELEIDPSYAVTVVCASQGYPESYEKGKTIKGLESVTDSLVFHAGTKQDPENNDKIKTNGGRVLAVTSLAKSIKKAAEKSYKNIEKISFDNKYFRKDIGDDLI